MLSESKWHINGFTHPADWPVEVLAVGVLINPESLGLSTPPEFEFRYIDIAAVTHGSIDWDSVSIQTFSTAPSRARRIIRPNDVLLSTVRPNLQSHTFADWMDDGNYICSTGFAVLRTKEDLEPKYLYHTIFGNAIIEQIRRLETGSNYPAIGERDVQRLYIPKPPLCEQRRIAEILDTGDAAIRQTATLIVKLKQIKAGLLQDLLTHGLDAHGQMRDPVTHPEQFKDSPLGQIPHEWGITSIGSLAVYVGSGVTPLGGSKVYRHEGITFIRSQNVTFDGLLLDDVVFISSETHEAMKRSEVYSHDVLLNITGASIGRCCVFPLDIGVANVNQHVCVIRLPNPTYEDATLLSEILASPIGQHQIDRLNAGGNREGLNYGQLRSFVIPWAQDEERKRITYILMAQTARIRTEEAMRDKLQQLKQGLMADLLTGRVRVGETGAGS